MTTPDGRVDFDPSEAFCIRGCGRRAIFQVADSVAEDGTLIVEMHCGDEECAIQKKVRRQRAYFAYYLAMALIGIFVGRVVLPFLFG